LKRRKHPLWSPSRTDHKRGFKSRSRLHIPPKFFLDGENRVILVAVNIPLEDHSRIVDFLPDHDFSAFYEIRVKAPASVV